METPTKQHLIEDLKSSFNEVITWVTDKPEDAFNKELIENKWTIAGHVYHLIKTTKAVTKGMAMPKLGLRAAFGKSNRPERDYEGMLEKYTTTLANTNVTAPSSYESEPGRTFDREELIKRFNGELNDFINALEKWKEEDMSKYIMPHPAIGKCTIREFAYFTILHTRHHYNVLEDKYAKLI